MNLRSTVETEKRSRPRARRKASSAFTAFPRLRLVQTKRLQIEYWLFLDDAARLSVPPESQESDGNQQPGTNNCCHDGDVAGIGQPFWFLFLSLFLHGGEVHEISRLLTQMPFKAIITAVFTEAGVWTARFFVLTVATRFGALKPIVACIARRQTPWVVQPAGLTEMQAVPRVPVARAITSAVARARFVTGLAPPPGRAQPPALARVFFARSAHVAVAALQLAVVTPVSVGTVCTERHTVVSGTPLTVASLRVTGVVVARTASVRTILPLCAGRAGFCTQWWFHP